MRSNKFYNHFFPVILVLFVSYTIQAQNSAYQKTEAFTNAAKANAVALSHYSWQMRVELTVDGDPKPASLYQLNFDQSGKLQKTELSAPAPAPTGLGKRIKANKIDDFKEWGGKLADLVKQYMAPSAGTLLDFFSKATEVRQPSGLVLVSGTNFIQPGDQVSYLIDPATSSPKNFSFSTALDGDPVTGSIDYKVNSDGLKYPGTINISAPAKKVTANIENLNFIKQL